MVVMYEDSTSAYKEVRFGAAGWTYSRMYVTKFSQVSSVKPVVYDARTNVLALRLNTSYLERRGMRLRVNVALGIGDVRSQAHEESLDRLFEPAGPADPSDTTVETSNVLSGQLEGTLSYRFALVPHSASVNLHVEPGVPLDYFFSQFDVFDKETLRDEEASNKFTQGDWIILPWMRVSLSVG